jgi:type IV pilus assembly protein PilO
MTNFQAIGARRISREQVLFWSPVILGGVLAAAAGALVLWPAVQQLQRDQQQLSALRDQEARLPLLRQQLVKQQDNLGEAQQKESRILQLIAGSGDISTFMSQLGQEASRSGVQLDSYEPVTTAAPPAGQAPNTTQAKPDDKAPPPPPPDPLLAPGLQKTSLLITARGNGLQLQDFLRRVERLSLLVVQSDLTLKFEPPPAPQAGKPPGPGVTTLKLNLALYSKAAASAGPANTPAPAASGAAPAKT